MFFCKPFHFTLSINILQVFHTRLLLDADTPDAYDTAVIRDSVSPQSYNCYDNIPCLISALNAVIITMNIRKGFYFNVCISLSLICFHASQPDSEVEIYFSPTTNLKKKKNFQSHKLKIFNMLPQELCISWKYIVD